VFVYIIVIVASMLSFMALLSCLRFIFTRQCFFWIVPLLISLILLYQNINMVIVYGEEANAKATLSVLLPAFLSLFWYAHIVIFHYALKLAIPENKYINDSRKNLKEAMYIEKCERRKNRNEREDYKNKKTSKNSIPNIPAMHDGKLVD